MSVKGGPGIHNRYRSHVFLCAGKTCAQKWDPEKAKAFLKEALKERGLGKQFRICTSSCLDLCDEGPNLVSYPREEWRTGLSDADLPKILEHLLK